MRYWVYNKGKYYQRSKKSVVCIKKNTNSRGNDQRTFLDSEKKHEKNRETQEKKDSVYLI